MIHFITQDRKIAKLPFGKASAHLDFTNSLILVKGGIEMPIWVWFIIIIAIIVGIRVGVPKFFERAG